MTCINLKPFHMHDRANSIDCFYWLFNIHSQETILHLLDNARPRVVGATKRGSIGFGEVPLDGSRVLPHLCWVDLWIRTKNVSLTLRGWTDIHISLSTVYVFGEGLYCWLAMDIAFLRSVDVSKYRNKFHSYKHSLNIISRSFALQWLKVS